MQGSTEPDEHFVDHKPVHRRSGSARSFPIRLRGAGSCGDVRVRIGTDRHSSCSSPCRPARRTRHSAEACSRSESRRTSRSASVPSVRRSVGRTKPCPRRATRAETRKRRNNSATGYLWIRDRRCAAVSSGGVGAGSAASPGGNGCGAGATEVIARSRWVARLLAMPSPN